MLIPNSSFEDGAGGWRPVNLAADVTQEIVGGGESSYSGNQFLRVRTVQGAGSVAIDFPAVIYGDTDGNEGAKVLCPSVGVFAWLRSAPGQAPISGDLTIWQLNLGPRSISHSFTVGNEWTLMSSSIEISGLNNFAYIPLIRVEFYIFTVNTFLDIDSVLAF